MAAKRKIPTLAERVSDLSPGERRAYLENYWRDWYLPRLTKEKPARLKRFLVSRHKHFDLYDDLLLGYEWRVSKDAQDLLLLLARIGCKLPAHFLELQQIRIPPPETDERATIIHWLCEHVEKRDTGFFRDIADALERLPEKKTPSLMDAVKVALWEGRKLYTQENDSESRGRSYLQRLLYCVLECRIAEQRRLPSLSELRQAIKTLMGRPPGKRAFDNAIAALGLAPPVLM